MTPVLTLYILGGCVAAAALVFLVMLVWMALHPPQMPNLSMDPLPPLQRMIRALTPAPFASAAGGSLEAHMPTTVPRAPVMPRPPVQHVAARVAAPSFVPAAPAFVPPPARPAPVVVAPPPPPPVFAPQFVWALPAPAAAPPALVIERRAVSRPEYRQQGRLRTLLRFVVGVFMLSVAAAGAVVAYPAMLDPLCDDYEWIGAETTAVVRQRASDAHEAIAEFGRRAGRSFVATVGQ